MTAARLNILTVCCRNNLRQPSSASRRSTSKRPAPATSSRASITTSKAPSLRAPPARPAPQRDAKPKSAMQTGYSVGARRPSCGYEALLSPHSKSVADSSRCRNPPRPAPRRRRPRTPRHPPRHSQPARAASRPPTAQAETAAARRRKRPTTTTQSRPSATKLPTASTAKQAPRQRFLRVPRDVVLSIGLDYATPTSLLPIHPPTYLGIHFPRRARPHRSRSGSSRLFRRDSISRPAGHHSIFKCSVAARCSTVLRVLALERFSSLREASGQEQRSTRARCRAARPHGVAVRRARDVYARRDGLHPGGVPVPGGGRNLDTRWAGDTNNAVSELDVCTYLDRWS